MKATNQRRQYVRVQRMKIIAWTIKISRHERNGVEAILNDDRLGHILKPAILAIAYHSLVASSAPVNNASSRIGCPACFG
jgi:hypothetical protein